MSHMRINRSVLSGVLRSTLTMAAAMAILIGATTSALAQDHHRGNLSGDCEYRGCS
jgi:hypothetical protein